MARNTSQKLDDLPEAIRTLLSAFEHARQESESARKFLRDAEGVVAKRESTETAIARCLLELGWTPDGERDGPPLPILASQGDEDVEISRLKAFYVPLVSPHAKGLKPSEIEEIIRDLQPQLLQDPFARRRIVLDLRKLAEAKIVYRSSGGAYRVRKRGVAV
jgi:hypothetical protein